MTIEEQRSDEFTRSLRELQVNGYTVLNDSLAGETLSRLQTSFRAHLDAALIAEDARTLKVTGPSRYNVHIPLEGPFLDPELVANPLVMDLARSLLDGDVTCCYYGADTALPGSKYQPAHSDEPPLFPGLPVTLPPVGVILDVPLVDFTSENGPLEVWNHGTHLIPDAGLIPKERPVDNADARSSPNQQLAEDLPSHPVLITAGSFLLRDSRIWHRGTANVSDEARPMLAVVYCRPWHHYRLLPIKRSVLDSLDDVRRALFRNAPVGDD